MATYIGAKKVCVTCNEAKELTEFYGHKRTADRLQSNCKECGKAASRESRGQKRIAMREVKAEMKNGVLGYQIALGELEKKYEEAKRNLAIKYHKGVGYGALKYEAEKGAEDLGIRGSIPQSVSDHGQSTCEVGLGVHPIRTESSGAGSDTQQSQ